MGSISNTTKGNTFWFSPDDERILVITDKGHKLYDQRVEIPLDSPDLLALTKSIAGEGILVPVIARKVGDFYEITEGRQRVRCGREAFRLGAKHVKIPVIVRTHNDYEASKIAVICNVQRIDDPPHVRGFNAKRLLESGASWPEIEKIFGAKKATIDGWIKVSDAPEEVHKAVESGEITATQAVAVSKKATKGGSEATRMALKSAKEETRNKVSGVPLQSKKRTVTFVVTESEDSTWRATARGNLSKEEITPVTMALDELFCEMKSKLGF